VVKCYCSALTQLRRLCSWLAVAGVLLAFPRHAAPSLSQSVPAGNRFEQWLAIVDAHKAGDPGMGVVEVSTWTGAELEAVVAEAKRHARVLAKTDVARANQTLLRGAALHADIGRLIPEDTARKSPTQKEAYAVRDGRWLGIRYISMHWQLGRSLLDGIMPDPALEPGVRAWYHELATDLLRMRQFAAAADHFARARQMYPTDPDILFASGVLHERFGSTALQAAAESINESNRAAPSVSSARGELARAERFFRDSLAYRPDRIEARVRHGRVLDDLDRHEEAAVELRRAIAEGAGGDLLYLAQLFLGRAEEALGNREASRAAFERASALYPNAQSPRLALSQIARRIGDRAAAQRELQFISKLPDDERRREDPWWLYYESR
jgi:tetratricopeptide (TPR) repeat protein